MKKHEKLRIEEKVRNYLPMTNCCTLVVSFVIIVERKVTIRKSVGNCAEDRNEMVEGVKMMSTKQTENISTLPSVQI